MLSSEASYKLAIAAYLFYVSETVVLSCKYQNEHSSVDTSKPRNCEKVFIRFSHIDAQMENSASKTIPGYIIAIFFFPLPCIVMLRLVFTIAIYPLEDFLCRVDARRKRNSNGKRVKSMKRKSSSL